MDQKIMAIIIAAILIGVAFYAYTVYGADGIEVPWGDEATVSGIATFHIDAIQPDGTIIDITSGSDAMSVMYSGFVVDSFSSYACVKATDNTGQFPLIKVDMGSIDITYNVIGSAGGTPLKADTHSLSGIAGPFLADSGVHTGQCSGGDVYDIGAVMIKLNYAGDFTLKMLITGSFSWAGCTEAGVVTTAWTADSVPANTFISIPLSTDLTGAMTFDWDISHGP